MPTVAELRETIKAHQGKNCQKISGLRKADLLKIASRIKRVRTQREVGAAVINRAKKTPVKKLTAASKKFNSSLTLKKPVKKQPKPKPMSFAEIKKHVLRISAQDRKATAAAKKPPKKRGVSQSNITKAQKKAAKKARADAKPMSFAEVKKNVLRISARDNKLTAAAVAALQQDVGTRANPPKKRGASTPNLTKAQKAANKKTKAAAKTAAKAATKKKYTMTAKQKSQFRQVMSQVKDPTFRPEQLPMLHDPFHKRDQFPGIIGIDPLKAPSKIFSELYREPGDWTLNAKQKALYEDRMDIFKSEFPLAAKAIRRGMRKLEKNEKKKYRFLLATVPTRELDDLIRRYV